MCVIDQQRFSWYGMFYAITSSEQAVGVLARFATMTKAVSR